MQVYGVHCWFVYGESLCPTLVQTWIDTLFEANVVKLKLIRCGYLQVHGKWVNPHKTTIDMHEEDI